MSSSFPLDGMRLRFAGDSNVGMKRAHNEDSFYLPESERPAALVWLKAFREQYGQNFLIVAGPAQGYGPLLREGLTPITIRPWSDLDVRRAT